MPNQPAHWGAVGGCLASELVIPGVEFLHAQTSLFTIYGTWQCGPSLSIHQVRRRTEGQLPAHMTIEMFIEEISFPSNWDDILVGSNEKRGTTLLHREMRR